MEIQNGTLIPSAYHVLQLYTNEIYLEWCGFTYGISSAQENLPYEIRIAARPHQPGMDARIAGNHQIDQVIGLLWDHFGEEGFYHDNHIQLYNNKLVQVITVGGGFQPTGGGKPAWEGRSPG